MPDTALVSALRYRRAPAAPRTLDTEARTVEVIASSFAPVARSWGRPDGSYGPWIEELNPAGIILGESLPVLADHRIDTAGLIGVIESARVAGGKLLAKVRLANVPRADEILALIADGALTGVSIGYTTESYKHTGERDGVPVFTATQWTVRELSFVPIPADPEARVRSADPVHVPTEEGAMPKTTITETAPTGGADDQPRAERERVAEINRLYRDTACVLSPERLAELHGDAIASGSDVKTFAARILDAATQERSIALGSGVVPTVRTMVSHDDPSVQIALRAEAIACRATGSAPSERARPYMSARLVDHARDLLEATGTRVGRYASADEVIRLAIQQRGIGALSTSDYPSLLQSAFARTLQVFLAAESPARLLARPREVDDFRPFMSVTFAGPRDLHEMQEGGEVPFAPAFDRTEQGAVKTHARRVGLTREALINDDLSAFSDPARLFANAVQDSEAQAFVAHFAVNGSGWGPDMSDGNPLFSAAHQNVASGAAGSAGIAAGRLAMRGQQLPGGGLARVTPRHVLTGPTSETALELALSELATATSEADRPIFSGKYELHVEPRLTGAAFFLFANPAEAPVLEFVTLRGTGGRPVLETFAMPDFLGVQIRCTHDFTIAPAGWVGAVRVSGS